MSNHHENPFLSIRRELAFCSHYSQKSVRMQEMSNLWLTGPLPYFVALLCRLLGEYVLPDSLPMVERDSKRKCMLIMGAKEFPDPSERYEYKLRPKKIRVIATLRPFELVAS